jgi:2-oxoglutarate dehydrogenase E1 component
MFELPETLSRQSLEYVEDLYAQFVADPNSIDPRWRRRFELASDGNGQPRAARFGPSFRPASIFNPAPAGDGAAERHDIAVARLQERVDQLIRSYRVRGHTVAAVDPLGMPRAPHPELDPSYYRLGEADYDRPLSTASIAGPNVQSLRGILDRLQNTYCRSIGVQFMHIDDVAVRQWLQRRMEGSENRLPLTRGTQLRILSRLTDAVMFEEFIRKRYVGAKSFSLEGAESLIPLLDLAIDKAGDQGVKEIVLGMAHRGRLNVLANVIGKSPQEIFREFDDVDPHLHRGGGDVKYHLGYSGDWTTSSGRTLHLSLCFNPSHLEFVNPVALGRMRAKQDRADDSRRETGMVVLIHGDAAFAGEGIVQETLNLSQLPGYRVGGALHVIVNNQIGFTTTPSEATSSNYVSDVAKMLQIPIFHVNGEQPEAVAQVVNLAMDFRREFGRDVVINMYCYRRWGHNEGDEPAFTQPLMYAAIERRESVRDSYLKHLLALGGVTEEEAARLVQRRREHLEAELSLARSDDYVLKPDTLGGFWHGYMGGRQDASDRAETSVARERLKLLLARLTKVPDDFHLHRKLVRGLDARRAVAEGEQPVDWSTAEALALASLAIEGVRIRLSGQDSQRGTFSQRHAVWHDTRDGHTYMPLAHLAPDQAPVEIYNSPLSEGGVLGFEYGYSLDYPDALVAWEAQYGDFVNAAQVIIDQFINSAEDKWRRLSGLVMLLPHGFEGQGPEHSSARLERFLALSAEDAMQCVVPTTPAQYFHCLRRQVLRRWRKPLIVFTPKSLLRDPRAVSPLDVLSAGNFQTVIPEQVSATGAARRVLLCTGKVYYDLLAKREALGASDVAIVRVEQLAPLPAAALSTALSNYVDDTPVFWVQEEPENMGAWPFVRLHLGERMLSRFPFSAVSRDASASPATGSGSSHRLEQAELLTRAFA